MKINLIVAVDSEGGIGLDGKMPWFPLKEDMKYFKEKTLGSIVIMGRKTWESIGSKPLSGRINLVVSSTLAPAKHVCKSLHDALYKCNDYIEVNTSSALQTIKLSDSPILDSAMPQSNKIFIIGGSEIYKEAMTYYYDNCDAIYITSIKGNYKCDVFFPSLLQNKFRLAWASELMKSENDIKYRFLRYDKCESINFEYRYLFLLNNIITKGDKRETRNGWTRSLFSERLQFDLNLYFPMATIRKVPIRWIFEELMWIIRGQTDTKILEAKGINIWKGNSSREFLDAKGLTHFKEGEIGPTYGFVMRNFGGDFDYDASYYMNPAEKQFERPGLDQLAVVLEKIKKTPNDRRMIISLWDPNNIDKCALPPCLRDYQFYVANGRLSCQATLRSSDAPVALHWNICTAGLLTHLCAVHCGLDVGELTMIIGDAHIYEEHVKEVQNNLLKRNPRPYPVLRIKQKRENIEDYEFSDLEIIGYSPNQTPLNLVIQP